MTGLRTLTPGDLEHLEFARAVWRSQGRREDIIRERFGVSITRHVQRVNAIIEHPQAQAYDAHLVARLRDRRDRLTSARVNGSGTA